MKADEVVTNPQSHLPSSMQPLEAPETSEATYPVQPVTQTTLAIADKRETARTEGGAE